jgi:hypothetical protein
MRRSNLFLWYLLANFFLLLVMGFHASFRQKTAIPQLEEKREMVRRLELTDLCVFTEANYTRHLSQADIHVPFQDHPLSLEHFPSGSLFGPPLLLKRIHERLD